MHLGELKEIVQNLKETYLREENTSKSDLPYLQGVALPLNHFKNPELKPG